jgi:hypothetical protein
MNRVVPAIDKPVKTTDKRGRGRPSKFSDALASAICARLSEGESLVRICEDRAMPARRTVLKWMSTDTNFCTSIARAREEQAEHLAEEIVTIADTCTDAHKARLQIDARKWYASKLAPKKYGDKLDLSAHIAGEIIVEIGGNID